MFDEIPTRFWLLLLLALVAWAPARYVWRHMYRSPSRRDITQPAEDLSWRSSGTLVKSVALLAGLAVLAGFIFNPAAADFARSPSFPPLVMVGLGGFALWSAVKGFLSGTVEPMVRGVRWTFHRKEHPKRFWASLAWNGLLGGVFLFLGGELFAEGPKQALRDSCHDWKDERSAKEVLAACDRLLAEYPDDDRSGVLAFRGSAYYRLGDYRRAGADYAAAIRLDPQDGSSHYNLGLVHELLDDREAAVGDYGAAIRVDANNAEAFAKRGVIFLDTGRFDRAIADFTRVQALQPANNDPVAHRGLAYAWKKDGARAEQDFAVVRRRDPTNVVVLHGQAVLAVGRGDIAGAVGPLSDAIARKPDDLWALQMRAEAYRQLGDREKMLADAAAAERLR